VAGPFIRLWNLKRTWNHLGRRDPRWTILTWSDRQGNAWEIDEFFATGRAEVSRVVGHLDRLRPGCPRRSALDFGCGGGQVTRALATRFDDAVGVDVASSMIARARELNADHDRCRFALNQTADLEQFETGGFDLVYSRMVLQHMPRSLVRGYIPELLRVLSPEGVLVFQLPAPIDSPARQRFLDAPVTGGALKRSLPRSLVQAWRRLKYAVMNLSLAPRMRMYGMDRDEVVALVESCGGHILEIHDDRTHGCDTPGFEYCVTT
jgi:SAM-dependent methyltransferase